MKLLKRIFKTLALPYELISGFTKGSLSVAIRNPDSNNIFSQQFNVFSQNGEDGILNFLTDKIKNKSRDFVEIGSANGINNNTSFLAIIKKFSGVMIEGDSHNSWLSRLVYRKYNQSVLSLDGFVNLNNINFFIHKFPSQNPDVLSIDIDGIDYYILKQILERGIRPKILVVEYNASFGPLKSICVPYDSSFDYSLAHHTRLYYGVSISGWRNCLEPYGYKLITVDSCGVNAFFVLISEFDIDFGSDLNGSYFIDNVYEKTLFNMSWQERFKLIASCNFYQISE